MVEFWREAWFFTSELFKFTTLFYVVWAPGFLIAALITCRFRYQAWNSVTLEPKPSPKGLTQAVALGIIGSSGRRASLNGMENLLSRAVSPSLAFSFLIASRNMTIYFWAIYALSLGAEFASGQVLGALIMIAMVTLALSGIKLRIVELPIGERHRTDQSTELAKLFSWRGVLLSLAGWKAIVRFIGLEIGRFAPSLAMGIVLGGIILAAGLRPWWPVFANVFGYATLQSDLVNALVGAALSPVLLLSPVGNLPVVHALFKTDGLSYPGIISLCLASAIHRSDIKAYLNAFGRVRAWLLVGLLYGAAVLGGLGSTWIYAAFGFRPSLPPVKLVGKLLGALLQFLGF